MLSQNIKRCEQQFEDKKVKEDPKRQIRFYLPLTVLQIGTNMKYCRQWMNWQLAESLQELFLCKVYSGFIDNQQPSYKIPS